MKTKLTLVSALFLFLIISKKSTAQTNLQPEEQSGNTSKNICGTEVPSQQWETQFQDLVKQVQEAKAANKTQGIVYTIPVIIHVIHGGQAVGTYPNIAQGQLNSQIQVLNNDYGGIGFNSGNYPATAFATYASNQNLPSANLDAFGRVMIANCNVQFCLATKDTLGNTLAEPGIERINYVTRGWTNPGSFTTNTNLQNYVNATIKPQTIWNVSKYLNIWVTDIGSAATLLGYATFPPLAGLTGLPAGSLGTNTTDGFWCLARAFGSQAIYPAGTYMTGYTRGRTSTHEIGHWLGLRHTWGDGTCLTDFCNDTPPNYNSNFGSPAYPLNATGTNSCSGAVNGAMFMNFMDYTDDPVKYMFTTDQATRIQTAMTYSPYRKFLGTHNLCSVAAIAATSQFNLPARVCGSAVITPTNNSLGTPVPSYTWSSASGVVFSPNANVSTPAISFPSPGIYTITLTVDNGVTASSSKTINAFPTPTLVNSTPTKACLNHIVTITASGANSYAWLPLFTVTNSISYVASDNKTFTITATDANQCKTTDSVTVYVIDCTGISANELNKVGMSIYPNPASNELNLNIVTIHETGSRIEVSDALGHLVFTKDAKLAEGKNKIQIPLESLVNGIYFLRVETKEGNLISSKFVKE